MKTKLYVLAVALAVGLSTTAPTQAAGIPVIDAANLTQQMQQVAHMVTQIENLRSQLDQAKQQYEALTGNRGFESLSRGNYGNIPTNWQETLATMESGGNISGLAQQIKEQARRVDTQLLDQVEQNLRTFHDDQLNASASHLAASGEAYDSAAERMDRLQSLMDAIPQATDMKGIADLQARISVEQVMLQNEQIRLQAMAQAAEAQGRIEDRQDAELGMLGPTQHVQPRSIVRAR